MCTLRTESVQQWMAQLAAQTILESLRAHISMPARGAVFANHHLYSNLVTFAYSLANDTVLAQLLLPLEFVAR